MSSPPRVLGLVCEGSTDVLILEAVVRACLPSIQRVLVLQPEHDEATRRPKAGASAGWSAVRAWCRQHADSLSDGVIDPPLGDRLDILLVAMDMDVAIEAEIADPPAGGVGSYETSRLCDTIKGWLSAPGRARLPPEVVIAIPTMAVEAWIVAMFFPRQARPEDLQAPAELLVERGRLERRGGKPHKQPQRYVGFGAGVVRKLSRVRASCREAERLCRKLESRRQRKGRNA